MVTSLFHGGVAICPLVCQAQLEPSWYPQAFQEPYDGNHQQLHFVPHFIQKVEETVLHDGHWLLEFGQTVLQSFGQPKQRLRQSFYKFLSLQSC